MNQVDVCNLALGWLGARQITSVEDDSTEARLCKASYEATRDAICQAREWRVCVTRRILAPTVAVPEFGWLHQFLIPSDVFRVLRCEGETGESTDWDVEGAYIVANDDEIRMVGLQTVTDTMLFSPAFCHAFAARLAADLCIPINQSSTMARDYWKLYEMKLREAAALDGMQGRTKQQGWLGLSRVR